MPHSRHIVVLRSNLSTWTYKEGVTVSYPDTSRLINQQICQGIAIGFPVSRIGLVLKR